MGWTGLTADVQRLNGRLKSEFVLELVAPRSQRTRGRRADRQGRLALRAARPVGAVAIVPIGSARTRRQRLLSLSRSVAECAMLLGLGASIYVASRQGRWD